MKKVAATAGAAPQAPASNRARGSRCEKVKFSNLKISNSEWLPGFGATFQKVKIPNFECRLGSRATFENVTISNVTISDLECRPGFRAPGVPIFNSNVLKFKIAPWIQAVGRRFENGYFFF